MVNLKSFPHFFQKEKMDCGPTCIKIVAKYYGKVISSNYLRELSAFSRSGTSLKGLIEASEAIGFRSMAIRIPFNKLTAEAPVPCIAFLNSEHFVVIYKFTKNYIYISDPAKGRGKIYKHEFLKKWNINGPDDPKGIVLLLEPQADFYKAALEDDKRRFSSLMNYLKPYKKQIFQLFLGLIIGSSLQLIFPFLTQSIVDVGIKNENVNFITIILIAQLVLFISRSSVDFIRSWILLHIGTRVNIAILSDFIVKLLKLPISYFDNRTIGETMQRINDHTRIESFLTSTTLNLLFSIINILIFGTVLLVYDSLIFAVFLAGSLLHVCWIIIFMKKRKALDFERFNQMSLNSNKLIQLVSGINEIKLHNAERSKLWSWQHIQTSLFKVKLKSLSLNQWQEGGSISLSEFKNIIITFISAQLVINGEITLGMMLAIQYILGQLNAPIGQIISMIQTTQDAKISFDRLSEVHNEPDDDDYQLNKLSDIAGSKDLIIKNVSFRYPGQTTWALSNLNFSIPAGKITAIVGASGSGKTTLLKLLMKFYRPTQGDILLEGINLNHLSNNVWREKCGAVLQDGYIFSDSIENNIHIRDNYSLNLEKIHQALKMANISDFVNSLPSGYKTKIGSEGRILSQGQKQRILIARAVYKNPEYLFFDEATNALDANNEKIIINNLNDFFIGRTVVVVAHRLSTVQNADQILVLDNGKVVEAGKHKALINAKGEYYRLVRNQLELGN